MGNDECCICARVLNEQESTVKEFYYENNYDCAIPAEHNIPSYNIADFLSDWRIRNVGSFTAQPNSEVTFRAKDEIILVDGFWAKEGSNFHAYNDYCGESSLVFGSSNPGNSTYNNKNQPDFELKLFPNPVESEISLKFPQEYRTSLIKIYSVEGILVYQEPSEGFKPSEGYKIDVSGFASGVYYVLVKDKVLRFVKI